MGIDGIDLNAMMKTSVVFGCRKLQVVSGGPLLRGDTLLFGTEKREKRDGRRVETEKRKDSCHVTICLGLPFFFVLLDKKNK
jgi:hypothetical protein